ncbi:polymorphic toxin type 15 domain-containing protein [Burkholderia cepacia]|uniref:polymorphic toxin type 15 domain-containing protein n=1 Tax=Burkholderia cepacia TaxID=292 RepID=UPI0018C62F8D
MAQVFDLLDGIWIGVNGRGVSSSIGSQWKDRVAELDEAAKKVPEAERGGD